MSSSEKPPALFSEGMLQRAMLMGLVLFAVMIVTAGLVYGLLSVIGWAGTGTRGLISLLVAPLLVTVIGGMGWLVWRSGVEEAETETPAVSTTENHEDTDDEQ